jgi:glycerol-3-phosphate dehydrogenase
MFAISWHNHTLLGTTDTPITEVSLEPRAMDEEIDFILETAAEYLAKRPTRGDVLSVFAGIRPLVKAEASSTAALSREHTIDVSKSGLLSIAGGKWTTYRRMAEDCVDHAATLAKLEERACVTRTLRIHGCRENCEQLGELWYYGADAAGINDLIATDAGLGRQLTSALPIVGAQVVWAVREEMGRSLEDVLARRTRALFLNAGAAIEMAPEAARLMAVELGRNEAWQRSQVEEFASIVRGYQLKPA